MSSTTFTDGTTPVVASWLNDVNTTAYITVPSHTTTLASGVVLKDSATGAASIPAGTTAQRPSSPTGTLLRYNTTISNWEGYNGSTWGLLATGFAASGANNDITSLLALTAGGLPDNSVLTADIANAQVTPAKLSQPLTLGTAVASTSGTAIDFTGIPSWVKRITVMLSGVSSSGASDLLLRVGDGSVVTTGYAASWGYFSSSVNAVITGTTGFGMTVTAPAEVNAMFVLTLMNSATNTWVCTQSGGDNNASGSARGGGGRVSLGSSLDRLRLTYVNGTDTFDAGSINIMYE